MNILKVIKDNGIYTGFRKKGMGSLKFQKGNSIYIDALSRDHFQYTIYKIKIIYVQTDKFKPFFVQLTFI